MKPINAWYGRIARVLLLLVMAGTVAMAAVPSTPTDMAAVVLNVGNGPYVQLTWAHKPSSPNGMSPDFIDVYQKGPQGDFSLVGTVLDSIPVSGFYTRTLAPGAYSYYVIARNDEGSSDPSETVSVVVSDKAVRFTATPFSADTVFVGETYTTTLEAIASSGEAVSYNLVSGPGSIDPVSGVYSYTPTSKGYISIAVRATLNSDPNISALCSWLLVVMPDPSAYCSSIHGSITDAATGAAVPDGIVYAYPSDSSYGATMASARFSKGLYALKVLPGEYKLYAVPDSKYAAAWYGNVESSGDAEIIRVKCDTVNADFALNMIPEPVNYTVSGRVTRKSDGSGVAAWITFTTGAYVSGGPYHSDTVLSNADGYYSLVLEGGRMYAALAVSTDGLLAQQFYKNANTFEQATLITLDGNRNDIDFELKDAADLGGAINGMVIDSMGLGLYAEIRAYKVSDIKGQDLGTPAATTSARAGQFYLGDLEKGAYIVQAIPWDTLGAYAPGYYREGDYAARTWQKGTRVVVTPNQNTVQSIKIILDAVDGMHGMSNLKGHISSQKGHIKQDGGTTQSAAPVEGAVVYAIDAQDKVNGYAMTDASGEYEIDGLSTGTYSVMVDKIGYEVSIESVTIGSDGESQTIDVPMAEVEEVSGVSADQRVEVKLSAYPNPTRESVVLRFEGEAGTSVIRMVDASGQEVIRREVRTEAGQNEVRLEASGLGSGMYYVRIESGAKVGTVQVTVLR